MKFNAELLKKLRNEKRYTFRQVGSFVGMTAPYISTIEKGSVKNPSAQVVEKLAELFGVAPMDFMINDEIENDRDVKSIVDLNTLRELRVSRKWSLREAASHAGIDFSTLSRIENGQRRAVSPTILNKIAEVYGVEMDDLLLQREEYINLSTLVLQSDTVIIDGEEIDISESVSKQKMLEALKIAAAWVQR